MNEALSTAQRSLSIQSVNLKQSEVFVGEDVDPPTIDRNLTVVQRFRSVSQIRILLFSDDNNDNEEWNYRLVYTAGVRLIYSSDKEKSSENDFKPLVEIVGDFEAKYYSMKELTEDEIKEFSKNSVGYHVWPYWREYVQSSCTRIGLTPVFEIPVYFMPSNQAHCEEKGK